MKTLLKELDYGVYELNEAMIVVSFYLAFPLKMIAQMYFLQRTSRLVSVAEFFSNSVVLIEFCICVLQIVYWYDYYLFSGKPYPGNKYVESEIDYTRN